MEQAVPVTATPNVVAQPAALTPQLHHVHKDTDFWQYMFPQPQASATFE